MTKAEYAAAHDGNRERIGRVVTQPAVDGNLLLVETEDWEPSIADMLLVEGAHVLNPVTGIPTDFDMQLCVLNVTANTDGVAELKVSPNMVITGPYKNLASLPAAGAAIYRPAGEHLRAIHEWWMAHNP